MSLVNMECAKMESSASGEKLTRTSLPRNSRVIPRTRNDEQQFSNGSSTSDGNVEMKSFWEFLPDEVITTILACLPLTSLLRFCRVCKKWKGLLKDQHFQETRARLCGGEQLFRQYMQLMEKSPSFAGSQVVSSVGGLLLLTADASNDVHIIDPSKATLVQIPRMLVQQNRQYIGCGMVRNQNVPNKNCSGSRYYTVGMVMNPKTRVYNILAVTKGMAGPVAIQLYDSSQESWRMAGSILPERGQVRFHIVGVVLHEEALHCLSVGLNEDLTPKFRVLRHEKQQKLWHDLPGVFPRVRYDNRSSPLLFQHAGRLLFAGASSKNFYIWQYDAEKFEWSVIDFLPNVTLLGSQSGVGIYSHNCGDYLCVGTYATYKKYPPTVAHSLDRTSILTSVLMYNIVNKSWQLLAKSVAEKHLVRWLRRRFLYESSPFVSSSF